MGKLWGTIGQVYLDNINADKEFLPASNKDETTAANTTTRYPIASMIPNNTAASQDFVKRARSMQIPTSFIGRPATFS